MSTPIKTDIWRLQFSSTSSKRSPLRNVMNHETKSVCSTQKTMFYLSPNGLLKYAEIPEGKCRYDMELTSFDEKVTCIGAGLTHAVFTVGDKLFGIGSNSDGELLNIEAKHVAVPAEIPFECPNKVVDIVCGEHTTFLLTDTHEVYSFGKNDACQLGYPCNNSRKPFVYSLRGVVVVAIAAGSSHVLVLSKGGLVCGAGSNRSYQLGFDSCGQSQTFKICDNMKSHCIKHIAANRNTSAAIDSNGKVYFWGEGNTTQMFNPDHGDPFIDLRFSNTGAVAILSKNGRLVISQNPFINQFIVVNTDTQVISKLFSFNDSIAIVYSNRAPVIEPLQFSSQPFSSLSNFNEYATYPEAEDYMAESESGVNTKKIRELFRNGSQNDIKIFSSLLKDVITNPLQFNHPSIFRFEFAAFAFVCETTNKFPNVVSSIIEIFTWNNRFIPLDSWLSCSPPGFLETMHHTFNQYFTRCVRENGMYGDETEHIASIIKMIHNSENHIPYRNFYSPILNKRFNEKEEYSRYESQGQKWCYIRNFPFILSTTSKRKFVILDSTILQKDYQRNILRDVHGDVSVDQLFLHVVVRRTSIVEDTFNCISHLNDPDIELRKPLRVSFAGEEGVDAGGVQREFFQLLILDMFGSENHCFTTNRLCHWFNALSNSPHDIEQFYLTGVIFGMALYNGNILNINFPLALYKKLKGKKPEFVDLFSYDEELANSLLDLLEYEDDISDLCMTFTHCGNDIVEGGSNKTVTNENINEYVEYITDYIFNKSIERQFEKFKEGFIMASGTITLELFKEEELQLLIEGKTDLDFTALEKITKYKGYDSMSPVVRNFWKIVHIDLDDEQKRNLLLFSTGTSRAPVGGLAKIPFVISRDPNPAHIPTSHTCFYNLVLPDDPDEQSLHRKLLIAIENSEGFALK